MVLINLLSIHGGGVVGSLYVCFTLYYHNVRVRFWKFPSLLQWQWYLVDW